MLDTGLPIETEVTYAMSNPVRISGGGGCSFSIHPWIENEQRGDGSDEYEYSKG